jgi:predicted dinucleotide-binding enzyme
MGRALGRRWASAGHEVVFSFSRDQKRLEKLARDVGHGATAARPADAVATADAVFVAVHWSTLAKALRQTGPLARRTVLTCMLPMNADDTALVVGRTKSGAEELARRSKAHVVAIFDTVPSELIGDPARVRRLKPDVIYCGDHKPSKRIAARLARDVGFTPIDAGPLRVARYLEPMGLAIAQLAYERGLGPKLGYRIVR